VTHEFQAIDKFFSNIDFLVPGDSRSSQYMVAIHKEFYAWATGRVAGQTVLDAGCGEGFGADTLAQTAEQVIAIDIKPELIEHARRRYPAANLLFQVMDCTAMDFTPGFFQVVICNEVIEHLTDYRAFLREAHRVLAPRGRFICATTNAEISFRAPDGSPMNRHHDQEFTVRTLRAELARHFDSVHIFSQLMNPAFREYTLDRKARFLERLMIALGFKHKIPIRLRNRVRQWLTGVDLVSATRAGFPVVHGEASDALYLIGIGEKTA